MPVRYDFEAARSVSGALRQLSWKLTNFAGQRATMSRSAMDQPDAPPATVPWTGQRRRDFDRLFRRQQSELAAMAELALTLAARVDRATTSAEKARKTETTN